MKISIKSQDITVEYQDDMSKIDDVTTKHLNNLIDKIHQKQHKREYCGATSQLPGVNVSDVRPSNPQMVKEMI